MWGNYVDLFLSIGLTAYGPRSSGGMAGLEGRLHSRMKEPRTPLGRSGLIRSEG